MLGELLLSKPLFKRNDLKKNGNPSIGQRSLNLLVVAKYEQVRQLLHADNLFRMLSWSTC